MKIKRLHATVRHVWEDPLYRRSFMTIVVENGPDASVLERVPNRIGAREGDKVSFKNPSLMKTKIKILGAILCAMFLGLAAYAQAAASTPATVGQSVTLTATVTAGTPPLSYAWTKNGAPVGTTATGAVLTLANVQLADGGTYAVTVSNAAGSTTSPGVVLAVSQVIPAGASITITVK